MKHFSRAFAAIVMPLAATGCAVVPLPGETVVTAPLIRSDSQQIGTVRMTAAPNGVMMHVEAAGLPPGLHGAHIHAVGSCLGPDFSSAGPHWDLSGHQHGRLNPAGPHDGDLGNFSVGPDGRLSADVLIPGAALPVPGATGQKVMRDADGASLVIHAAADDERTDPSGNSGARIACARIAVPLAH
jgi:Cu-Zn family superoxide dismutase